MHINSFVGFAREVTVSEKDKNEETSAEQDMVSDSIESQGAESMPEAEVETPPDLEAVVEKSLEEQLADAKCEVETIRDSMLRIAAESENFKKRMIREHSATLKYAGEHIFKEILPVVDNLERAVTQGVVEGAGAEQQLKALQEGVELTLKCLVTTLEKFEVKSIDSLGKPFDPVNHEALAMAPSEEIPANHVTTEFEKGYYYKDKLLRAAKVVVSSGS